MDLDETLLAPDYTGKGHDLDPLRPAGPQGRGGGVDGCSGRIDVVDEQDRARRRPRRERACDIAPALGAGETALPGNAAGAAHQLLGLETPAARELTRQCFRRMVPAPQQAVVVGRHECDAVDGSRCENVPHQVGRPRCEPPQSAFLPGRDDASHRLVVGDRGSGPSEGESAPGALGATLDGPGGRSAATRADGCADPPEARPAPVANLAAGEGAAEAALGQEQVEHADDGTRRGRTDLCQL